jgi:uncharacterized Tic20 family protein
LQTDQPGYGAIEDQARRAMSAQDERTWSILAHLSMFLNPITGFLGPVAALIIWLAYRDWRYEFVWLEVIPAGE